MFAALGRRWRSPITHGSALVAFERSKLALAPLIRSRRKILPRTTANAVTRIDGRLSVGRLGAQIGAPGFSSRAMTLRHLLTILVGTFKAAEIGALAGPHAGDKKRHVRRLRQLWRRLLPRLLLCLDVGRHAKRRERHCGDDDCLRLVHRSPLR